MRELVPPIRLRSGTTLNKSNRDLSIISFKDSEYTTDLSDFVLVNNKFSNNGAAKRQKEIKKTAFAINLRSRRQFNQKHKTPKQECKAERLEATKKPAIQKLKFRNRNNSKKFRFNCYPDSVIKMSKYHRSCLISQNQDEDAISEDQTIQLSIDLVIKSLKERLAANTDFEN